MPTNERYTRTAIILHWLVALGIVINLILVWTVDYAPDDRQRSMIDLHKSIGITVFGLALLRILWRYSHRPPELPAAFARWEQLAAKLVHIGLYGVMIGLPVSGWLHDSAWKAAAEHPLELFQAIPFPRAGWVMATEPVAREQLHKLYGSIHELLGTVLYVLLGLHIVGALKHQIIDRYPLLARMSLKAGGN